MGYSDKIGPVYFGDRDTAVSPHKLDEIESEVRRFVLTSFSFEWSPDTSHPWIDAILRALVNWWHFPGPRSHYVVRNSSWLVYLCLRSLIIAGESRVMKLLKAKEEELHRVSVTIHQTFYVSGLLILECRRSWNSLLLFLSSWRTLLLNTRRWTPMKSDE